MDTDVLIVGAGPVGLFLANECARRGLRWRLVEMRAALSEHSKALAINRVTSVAVVTHGRALARMRFAPAETPYSFVATVPRT